MKEAGEHYLGDGLYVSFDGYQIRLRAPRSGGDHEVFLEPPVLEAFLAYAKEIRGDRPPPDRGRTKR